MFVEYAKASAEDVLVAITVSNRASEAASLHVLPTVWFRNTWSWPGARGEKPTLRQTSADAKGALLTAAHPDLGERYVYSDGAAEWLFTENDTNSERFEQSAQFFRRVEGDFAVVCSLRSHRVGFQQTVRRGQVVFADGPLEELPNGGAIMIPALGGSCGPAISGLGFQFAKRGNEGVEMFLAEIADGGVGECGGEAAKLDFPVVSILC